MVSSKGKKQKNIRIYKIAKELDISSKELIEEIKDEGFDVTSHMSSVSPDEAEKIKEIVSGEKEKEEVKKEEAAVEKEEEKKIRKKQKKEKKKKPKKRTKKEKQKKARKTVKKIKAKMEGRRTKKKYRKEKKEEEGEEENVISIGEGISVSELGELIDVQPNEIISSCLSLGLQVTINQRLDFETASLIADEFGYKTKLSEGYEEAPVEEERTDIQPRPPIVTILGHVDHGKTTLLDYIRKTRVAAQESGGITQKIGAYHIDYNDKSITFIDTPGHEAFTAMRARGANITDIVVLVIAANEGVRPQTIEAIDHAKAAGVPIVVALNKIDLPNANTDKVRAELAEKGIVVQEYGGEVLAVEISALKGIGIEELLDAIVLQSEAIELKAPQKGPGMGIVLETRKKKGLGNIATVVVKEGEINRGDSFIAGSTYGKVRLILDETDKRLKSVGPSSAVQIAGFNDLPEVSDRFQVVEDIKTARNLSDTRKSAERKRELSKKHSVSLESFYERIEEGEKEILKVVIKGDDAGSIEALSDSLEGLSTDEVEIDVIHTGIGPITENDIMLASASDAIIIGYKVHPNSQAKLEAKENGVEIRTYNVIFEIIEDIKLAMSGLLEPEKEEIKTAEVEIREIFTGSRIGTIAGCYVLSGEVHNDDIAVLIRGNDEIVRTEIASLKRFDNDVKVVEEGYECGIKLKGFENIKKGDILETYRIVEKQRTI